MALTQNENVSWEDIKTLYQNLNTARTKFSFATVTVPENTDVKAVPSHITDLKSLIEAMTSNGYVGSTASTSGVDTPISGEQMRANPVTQMSDIVQRVNDVCVFNSSYFSSYFSSYNGSNFGYNSSFFSSNFGYDSSVNSSNFTWRSGNYTFFSGNHVWFSGNYSFNSPVNSSNFTWRSGNYSFRR